MDDPSPSDGRSFLVWFTVVAGLVGTVLLVWAAYWGATSKDVLLGIATGLLSSALVSVVIALAEDRRAALLRQQDEERDQRLRDQDQVREDRLREQDQKRNQSLWNVTFRLALTTGASVRGFDLRGMDLRTTDLSGHDLTGVILAGAILDGVQMQDSNLAAADLRHASMKATHLERSVLNGAMLQSADLTGVWARGTSFVNAYLNEATDFTNADFRMSLKSRKTTTFKGAHLCAGDETQPEKSTGVLKALGSRYDKFTEWPPFEAGPPPGSILDNSIR
jgi:uncharacterized protein YjbI with pentapeptide repeats